MTQVRAGVLLPEQSGREMDRVERAQIGLHGLRCAVEDRGVDLDELERIRQRQNRRAS